MTEEKKKKAIPLELSWRMGALLEEYDLDHETCGLVKNFKPRKVAQVDKDFDIEAMVEILKVVAEDLPDVGGLAADQIGVPVAVAIIKQDRDDWGVLVNPKITHEVGIQVNTEASLSDLENKVSCKRPREIVLENTTYKPTKASSVHKYTFKKETMEIDDSLSVRILCHIIDSMNGITMKDREYKAVKIGRNDPCVCGSGKKHKNCCYP